VSARLFIYVGIATN